jgi:hypothetical protein
MYVRHVSVTILIRARLSYTIRDSRKLRSDWLMLLVGDLGFDIFICVPPGQDLCYIGVLAYCVPYFTDHVIQKLILKFI